MPQTEAENHLAKEPTEFQKLAADILPDKFRPIIAALAPPGTPKPIDPLTFESPYGVKQFDQETIALHKIWEWRGQIKALLWAAFSAGWFLLALVASKKPGYGGTPGLVFWGIVCLLGMMASISALWTELPIGVAIDLRGRIVRRGRRRFRFADLRAILVTPVLEEDSRTYFTYEEQLKMKAGLAWDDVDYGMNKRFHGQALFVLEDGRMVELLRTDPWENTANDLAAATEAAFSDAETVVVPIAKAMGIPVYRWYPKAMNLQEILACMAGPQGPQ